MKQEARRLVKLNLPLPCGGKIEFNFMNGLYPCKVNDVHISVFPHVHCPGTYANGKGCPWFDRLRKFYTAATGLEEVVVDGKIVSVVDKTEINYRDRVVSHVGNEYHRGIAFVPDQFLFDRDLWPKGFEEGNDVFEECKNVKTRHDGIIAFFKRLIGSRK